LPPPVVERRGARHIRREPVASDRRSPSLSGCLYPAVGTGQSRSAPGEPSAISCA